MKKTTPHYDAVHHWIYYHYGKPTACQNVDCDGSNTRYEWANISGEYRHDREDFEMLCTKCHRRGIFSEPIAHRDMSTRPTILELNGTDITKRVGHVRELDTIGINN